jgi:hypothetical protein
MIQRPVRGQGPPRSPYGARAPRPFAAVFASVAATMLTALVGVVSEVFRRGSQVRWLSRVPPPKHSPQPSQRWRQHPSPCVQRRIPPQHDRFSQDDLAGSLPHRPGGRGVILRG